MDAIASGNIVGLPYEMVNDLLSLALEHDEVHLSEQAIFHMRERHPGEFALCAKYLHAVIRTPDYVGQAPHHTKNFEVIKEVEGNFVLVAICTLPDEHGDYPVESAYVIPRSTVFRRLRKKHLFAAK